MWRGLPPGLICSAQLAEILVRWGARTSQPAFISNSKKRQLVIVVFSNVFKSQVGRHSCLGVMTTTTTPRQVKSPHHVSPLRTTSRHSAPRPLEVERGKVGGKRDRSKGGLRGRGGAGRNSNERDDVAENWVVERHVNTRVHSHATAADEI